MRRNDVLWCPWLGRFLIFLRQIGTLWLFEDFGDQRWLLTEEEIKKLETDHSPNC